MANTGITACPFIFPHILAGEKFPLFEFRLEDAIFEFRFANKEYAEEFANSNGVTIEK